MANFCNHSPITASKAHTKVGQIKKQLKWINGMIEESKKIQYKSLYSSMSNIFIQACQISCRELLKQIQINVVEESKKIKY